MKNFKRILSIVLAMTMVLAMGMTAFATGTTPTTYSITINKHDTDQAAHVYEAYQIFAGDLASGKLSNITWGSGVDKTKLGTLATSIEALRTGKDAADYKALTATSTAQEFADAIAGLNATNDGATAQAVAVALEAVLSTTKAGTVNVTAEATSGTISGLEAGYYLVKDKDGSLGDAKNGAYTRYALQVVGNVTVTEKASVPTSHKKVKDTYDPEGDTSDWVNTGDFDIGDKVPFQITGTTASTVHDYVNYHVTFEDKQSAGLDAPEKFTVKVLGQTVEINNTVGQKVEKTVGATKVTIEVVAPETDGYTFGIKVSFENTTKDAKLTTAADSQKIEIEYTSVLNENAEIGFTGNPNEMFMKYSNNPNDDDEGKTPEEKVIVFTYKPIVNKVDENGDPLTGAAFTLYKEVKDQTVDGAANAKTGQAIKAELAAQNASIEASALEDAKYYVALTLTPDTAGTTFSYKGIDDGVYVLVETTIPAGYNAFKSEKITVTATHNDETCELTALSADKVITNAATTDGKLDGTLEGDVENKSGAVLPSTGGMGTTIFYIVGAMLAIGAAVVLVTKKRMNG